MKTTYPLIIDSSLWKRFKAQCALEGISMITKITNLIEQYLGE